MQAQNRQGELFSNQSNAESAIGLDLVFSGTKGPCSVFASVYKEDTHMTRIYSCRPMQEQTDLLQEYNQLSK